MEEKQIPSEKIVNNNLESSTLTPKVAKQSKLPLIVLLFAALCSLILSGFLYYQNVQLKKQLTQIQSTPTPTGTPIPTQNPSPSSTPENSLNVYKNEEYGFQISYPDNYQVLDSKNDLYGWPKGIVLFYNGGQAYDIVIEAWDTEAEYQSRYSSSNFEVIVKKIGNKYITAVDYTEEDGNKEIISTFIVLE